MKKIVFVAACDSPKEFKATADYICSGESDEILLKSVADQLSAGDEIRLGSGNFYIGNALDFETDDISVVGSAEFQSIIQPNNDAGIKISAERVLVHNLHFSDPNVDTFLFSQAEYDRLKPV